MNNIKSSFQEFLIKQGYKITTTSGNPSTVYDYKKRIDFVCEIENITWEQLAENIDSIINLYEPSGAKSMLGAKSHNAVISALKQFKIFVNRKYLLNNDSATIYKNKISNEFLKKQLSKNDIEYKSLKNSFYEINLSDNKYLLKCRTYNKNYTFVTKSEIPELSDNILIALVEWQNEQPISLYLIPTSEWNTGKWNILKDRDYEGLKSEPEWGIDINQSNKYELNNFQFSKFINTFKEKENKKIIEEIERSEEKETEKQALIKVRLGHSKLREDIIKRKGKCEICGISHNKLLIASHIKPWAKSDNFEKLDNANILLLCSMHDALFDKGLISFDDNGKILISKELNEEEQALVNINEDSCISIVSDKQKEYLKYHRENIFIK